MPVEFDSNLPDIDFNLKCGETVDVITIDNIPVVDTLSSESQIKK